MKAKYEETQGVINYYETATAGEEVTFDVIGRKGYILDTLTVKDAEGNEIETTEEELEVVSSRQFTFTMPKGDVTITATFVNVTYLEESTTEWTSGTTYAVPEDGLTISSAITVSGDVTLIIPKGRTLTVSGGISADEHTLTVKGKGSLVVTGKTGSAGSAGNAGSAGGAGFTGDIIVDGAIVTITVGAGGNGGNRSGTAVGAGGAGGAGITGNITVDGGTVTITGGGGGNGGDNTNGAGVNGGNGGDGGSSVGGNITVRGGSATITGGAGGSGGTNQDDESAAAGNSGNAVAGAITGSAEESDDNSSWSAVSGDTSTAQYIKF